MEYITKYCPKCNGELRIPENLKTCICMYCGEKIDLQEKEIVITPENNQSIEEDYQKALKEIPSLVEDYEVYMKQFTRKDYKDSFAGFTESGMNILKPVSSFYAMKIESQEKTVEEVTKVIMEAIENMLSKKSKFSHGEAFMQFRFFITCFMVPMIRHLELPLSEPLAESLVVTWNKKYPKDQLQIASYEQIEKGFHRKGLCFITTAVCETMNKQDDCYELTAFRNFRDTYMLQSEEGKKLVEEYYQIAPAIVTFLNMESDHKEKYMDLWKEYLNDCLKDIEENRLKSCEKRYVRMVRRLKSQYCIN